MNASDRLYLAENIPFLLVWGERDPIIPVEHGLAAHELVPSSRLEVFEDAGHFPHVDDPQRFLDVLLDFIDSTEPADTDPESWKGMLKSGRHARAAERRPIGDRAEPAALVLLLVVDTTRNEPRMNGWIRQKYV